MLGITLQKLLFLKNKYLQVLKIQVLILKLIEIVIVLLADHEPKVDNG